MPSTCTISLRLMGRRFLNPFLSIFLFLRPCIVPWADNYPCISEFRLSSSTMYVAVQYTQKELLMQLCFSTQRWGSSTLLFHHGLSLLLEAGRSWLSMHATADSIGCEQEIVWHDWCLERREHEMRSMFGVRWAFMYQFASSIPPWIRLLLQCTLLNVPVNSLSVLDWLLQWWKVLRSKMIYNLKRSNA